MHSTTRTTRHWTVHSTSTYSIPSPTCLLGDGSHSLHLRCERPWPSAPMCRPQAGPHQVVSSQDV
ncbi:hypothetical protein CVT25_007935, partial [Psilocybe cyanescens]